MFGDMVRAHRRRLGITQEELAGRTGVSVRSVQNIESGRIGRPRAATVRLLADAFALDGADRERFCVSALTDARGLRGDRPSNAGPSSWRPVPAQLPADVAGFVGRRDQLNQLTALLHGGGRSPTAVVISAIAGTAGVGKTALAVRWAHQVRERFPDGQLYVNLRGFDPSGTVTAPAEAVRGFLDTLDVPPQWIPANLDAQAGLYRSLLADRRMLIVLDNARDTDQIRPLLPGSPGCFVVVTSRNQLTGLVATDGAHPLILDLLDRAEARELLTHRLGPERIAAEPGAVEEILTRCVRLPLALAVAAARAATHPHFPLRVLAVELRDAPDGWNALSGGDPTTDVRAVFSWSYRTLSREAARLFRLLGLHPGPDISAPATASLAGLPAPRVRPLLAELACAHLIHEHRPGRYAFHDLLRAYASEQAHTHDPDQQRHAAVQRMLDHYLHTAHAADRLLDSAQDAITLPPPSPGVTTEPLVDLGQALTWFSNEHRVLIAAINLGTDSRAWQLACTTANYLDRQGHWADEAATNQAALRAARHLADTSAQARAHRLLGRAYRRLGAYADAHTHLRQALHLYGQDGDQTGQAYSHQGLGIASGQQGRYAEALEHALQALELYRAAGHQPGQAWVLNDIGWYHAHLGNHQQALTSCQQSLALLQQLGDRTGQADTLDSLGYAHHHAGQSSQAIVCYQRAVAIFCELGDRYGEAQARTHLGDTHHAHGDPQAARDAWQQALDIFNDIDHPDAEELRSKLQTLDLPAEPALPRPWCDPA